MVKQPPYDQDDDLQVTLNVFDKDDLATDPPALEVAITRPSGTTDSLAIGDLDHVATGAYRFTYRVPGEWGIYHGVAFSDLPDGDGRVVQQFDFPVQKQQAGP